MRKLLLCVVAVLLLSGPLFGENQANSKLTADEIRAIANKPDDRTRLMKELRINPDAKLFDVHISNIDSSGNTNRTINILGTEKWVDGKYIVSLVNDERGSTKMVLTYNRDAKQYEKSSLYPDGSIGVGVGTLESWEEKTIRWVFHYKGFRSEGTEKHTDNKTEWTLVTYRGNSSQPVVTQKGYALALKELSSKEKKTIEALIEKLGSDSFQDRNNAQKELAAIGKRAIPNLQKAGSHEDPEISSRAQEILKQLGVTNTNKHIDQVPIAYKERVRRRLKQLRNEEIDMEEFRAELEQMKAEREFQRERLKRLENAD